MVLIDPLRRESRTNQVRERLRARDGVESYLQRIVADGDRVDGNEAGVEDDLGDIVGDGLNLELG